MMGMPIVSFSGYTLVRYPMLKLKTLSFHPLGVMVAIASLIFSVCSAVRHTLFQSNAFELGIYDQVAFLISQGKTPISSFLEIHHLGNHAAWAMYPISLLYAIYPSVYWLLIVQAGCLALGVWPSWSLARQAGLNEGQSMAVATLYLLYPLVFNLNLFDFHPEVMALPAFLGAILAARLDRILWFTLAIIWILGCKAALSLTVAAMGFWLFFFEKKRWCGAIALGLGTGWFLIATQSIIPYFNEGRQHAGVSRYEYLGGSVLQIATNLILKPQLVLGRFFSIDTFGYLALLIAPVVWWLSPRRSIALLAAGPALAMNILSDIEAQRDLIHQYSLPILPFLIVAAIAGLEFKSQAKPIAPKLIIIWSAFAFILLAKYGYFGSIYLDKLDSIQAMREAVALVQPQTKILTNSYIAPHLTHRPVVKLTDARLPLPNLLEFDEVLLNERHPGWQSNQGFVKNLVVQLKNMPEFHLKYQRDEVYLFSKKV